MARRSNKTSHVLNLLTDPKSSESSTESSSKVSPPVESSPIENVESTQDIIDTTDAIPNTADTMPDMADAIPDTAINTEPTPAKPKRCSSQKQAPPASVPPMETLVDNSQALEDRISQQIQVSLSAQLAEEEAKDALRAEQDRKIAERIAAEAGMILPNDQAAPEPETNLTPTDEASATQPASIPDTEPEYDFQLVNVMEAILDQFQTEFMEKFGMCTCHRCWLDTRALTLSSLNGKYVVLDRDSVEPMLNFYDHRYRGTIMAQLTKACMTVMANPHH